MNTFLDKYIAKLAEKKIDWGESFEIRQVHLTPDEIAALPPTRWLHWKGWIVENVQPSSIFETCSMGFGPA